MSQLFSKLKETNNIYNRNYYKQYSNKLNHVKLIAKKTYYHKILEENKKNVKKIWKTLNSILNTKTRQSIIPSKVTINGIETNNTADINYVKR